MKLLFLVFATATFVSCASSKNVSIREPANIGEPVFCDVNRQRNCEKEMFFGLPTTEIVATCNSRRYLLSVELVNDCLDVRREIIQTKTFR